MFSQNVLGFQKQSSKKVPFIKGSKISIRNSQLLISTGVPSLDHVVGGGIPVGTIILLEEDVGASYTKILLKYFLSEGVLSSHSLLVASQDQDPQKLMQELPEAVEDSHSETSRASLDDKMTIAWRYQDLKTVDSSPSSNTFGHNFDLTKTLDKELLTTCNISCWKPSAICSPISNSLFHNAAFEDLLMHIKKTIDEGGFSITSNTEKRNILRIVISSLGSPLWCDGSDSEGARTLQQDMCLFLYNLRGLLRSSYTVCMLSVPSHLYNDTPLMKKVEHLCDTCVHMESFAGSEKETNPAFKDYHGLFHITKLSAINALPSHIPDSLDLAFKLRRKKFLIEKLHLPPELQESTQREQDDLFGTRAGSTSCGLGKGLNKLDF